MKWPHRFCDNAPLPQWRYCWPIQQSIYFISVATCLWIFWLKKNHFFGEIVASKGCQKLKKWRSKSKCFLFAFCCIKTWLILKCIFWLSLISVLSRKFWWSMIWNGTKQKWNIIFWGVKKYYSPWRWNRALSPTRWQYQSQV
jgi:hypothetical protein